MRSNTLATIAMAMAAAVSLAGCGTGTDNETGSGGHSGDQVSFMLDWTPNTNHVGLYVAQELGFFKDQGLTVKILPTAQAGAETSVENGVASMGFTTLSNVAAFDSKGANLKFIFDLTQKPVARWCALASRSDIRTPRDFSGKTFVSFGSAEQRAVVSQMITFAGGSGTFSTVTAGTNTFRTLTGGKGDFAGFYETWEGVESKLKGPALNCFQAGQWGVPGNPDQLGFAVNSSWLDKAANKSLSRRFLKAARKGYDYALSNPDKAADILIQQTKEALLDPALTHASMKDISDHGYWTTTDPNHLPASVDMTAAQKYLDFQFKAGTFTNNEGTTAPQAPQARQLASNDYIK